MKYGLIGIAGASLAALPAPARAQDFVGPRIEATAGWDQLRFDLDRYGATGSTKESDIAWGLGVGYDIPVGTGVVAGIDAGVTFSDVDHGFADATTSYTVHAKRDLDISGRLGTRIGSNALLYAKLGYTNLRAGIDTTVGNTLTADSRNLDGVRTGVGLEVAFSPQVYLKSEYRYSNYEDGITRNQIVTGLGFRF